MSFTVYLCPRCDGMLTKERAQCPCCLSRVDGRETRAVFLRDARQIHDALAAIQWGEDGACSQCNGFSGSRPHDPDCPVLLALQVLDGNAVGSWR